MPKNIDVIYVDIKPNRRYNSLVNSVLKECFTQEKLSKIHLLISVILTTDDEIQKINKEQRNIDKTTDVLSFPIYEKDEIAQIRREKVHTPIILGDIIICVPRVIEQSQEYGHSFKRELSYMLVHGFCHLIGYDHIDENEKQKMRKKEEEILEKLKIQRI